MKVKAGLLQMSLKGDTSMSPEEITCLEPSDFNRTVNVLMTSEYHSCDFQMSQGRVDSQDLGSQARPLR